MIEYKEFKVNDLNRIKEIYKESEWNAYLKDDNLLLKAFENSLYVYGAFEDGLLLGFIRMVGDGCHVVIVQDLIVSTKYQKMGIGTNLFKHVLDKYKDVRMFLVVTDIEDEVDNKFYKSFGFRKIEEGHMVCYER